MWQWTRIYNIVPTGLSANFDTWIPAAKAAGYNKVVPTGLSAYFQPCYLQQNWTIITLNLLEFLVTYNQLYTQLNPRAIIKSFLRDFLRILMLVYPQQKQWATRMSSLRNFLVIENFVYEITIFIPKVQRILWGATMSTEMICFNEVVCERDYFTKLLFSEEFSELRL